MTHAYASGKYPLRKLCLIDYNFNLVSFGVKGSCQNVVTRPFYIAWVAWSCYATHAIGIILRLTYVVGQEPTGVIRGHKGQILSFTNCTSAPLCYKVHPCNLYICMNVRPFIKLMGSKVNLGHLGSQGVKFWFSLKMHISSVLHRTRAPAVSCIMLCSIGYIWWLIHFQAIAHWLTPYYPAWPLNPVICYTLVRGSYIHTYIQTFITRLSI